jgi:hypothetical protein
MADLFGRVMDIPLHHGDGDLWVFQLPDGGKVEIFGPQSDNPHFTTGPVPGFLVDDVDAATEELRSVLRRSGRGHFRRLEAPLRRDGRARGGDDPARGVRVWELSSGGVAPATGGTLEPRVGVAVALHETGFDRRAVEPLARDVDLRIALAAREGAEPA